MSKNIKKTVIKNRYVEVYNVNHAEEISRLLNSSYNVTKSNYHSRDFSNNNHRSFWVKVPKGKWGYAKTTTKTVCGGQTSRCRLYKFICSTEDGQIIIKTS